MTDGRVSGSRRPLIVLAIALAVAVLAVVAFLAGRWWPDGVTPSTSPVATGSSPATGTATPSTEPTASATPTAAPSTSTAEPSPSAAEPAADPPGPVTAIESYPGGGSEEICVAWDTVDGATGYRVYRALSPDGPFVASASVSGTQTTVEYDGDFLTVGIWPPSPTRYEYVEAGISPGPVYFVVRAFDADGEGPASAVVCGSTDQEDGC